MPWKTFREQALFHIRKCIAFCQGGQSQYFGYMWDLALNFAVNRKRMYLKEQIGGQINEWYSNRSSYINTPERMKHVDIH